MHIDVYFDLICPWCWIGKRHLSEALAQWERQPHGQKPAVAWHGAPLLPDLPLDGVPYQAFYLQRLGSEQAIRMRQNQVQAAARNAGLAIHFEAMQVMPHTGRAHQLLKSVGSAHPTLHGGLMEALFRAHFVEGRNIGELATLLDIAQQSGVDRNQAVNMLLHKAASPGRTTSPSSGVPTFDFGPGLVLSGAQPVPVLLEALRQASTPHRLSMPAL